MVSLLKRDFFIYGWSKIYIPIIFILGAGFPPELILFITVIAHAFSLFQFDSKSTANHYIISLPIRKNVVVRSRYLFILSMAVFLMLLQWLLNYFVFFDLMNVYVYQWQDSVVFLSFFLIVSAIVIPMYYFFHSFFVAVIVQIVLYLISLPIFFHSLFEGKSHITIDHTTVFLASWIEKVFSFQPYILFPALALVMYFLSMNCSDFLFKRRFV